MDQNKCQTVRPEDSVGSSPLGLKASISVIFSWIAASIRKKANASAVWFPWKALWFQKHKLMIEHSAPVQLSLLLENLYKHKFLLQYLMQMLNKRRRVERPRMLKTACFTENTSYLISEHHHQHIHPRSCEDLLFYAFTFRIFASTGENNRFLFTRMFTM